MNPFVEGSAHGLERRVLRDKAKGSWPWTVRYGEDGKPRWMKRVFPEVDFSALRAAAVGTGSAKASGFGNRGMEEGDGNGDEGEEGKR